MKIDGIDHLVLTVRDLDATCQFYSTILGMEVVVFGNGRKALQCGGQKINLHQYGHEFEPKAHTPAPGSADLCLITGTPIAEVLETLQAHGVAVVEGPVERTGARGPILSVYLRDPDQNLIEIANYRGASLESELQRKLGVAQGNSMPSPIYFFTKNDPFYELSNFAPYGFEEEGLYWPTVEHYFQAQKFAGEANAAYRERIRISHSPKDAKTLGQTRAVPIRPDWDEVKEEVMRHALRKKFAHPKLRALLLSTDEHPLIENSPYDRYWGIGKDGSGRNRLGALLMELRDELRGEG